MMIRSEDTDQLMSLVAELLRLHAVNVTTFGNQTLADAAAALRRAALGLTKEQDDAAADEQLPQLEQQLEWHGEVELPAVDRAWYQVRRRDGSLCVRAWGDGGWWIPLLEGWLSGLPPGFSWRGPVAWMDKTNSKSPIAEARGVEARWTLRLEIGAE